MQYLINLVPVVFNILLLPLWYMESTYGFWTYGRTSFFELILNSILGPIFLLIFNAYLIRKRKKSILYHLLLMVFSIISSAFVHYFNWGIVSGNFFNPDGMTIGLVLFVDVLFPFVFIDIGMSIYAIFKTRKNLIRKGHDNEE